jgi:predicted phosphodiesterase
MLQVKDLEVFPLKMIKTSAKKIHIWIRADTHHGHEDTKDELHEQYLDWLSSSPDHMDLWLGDICEFAVPTARKYKFLTSQTFKASKQWIQFQQWIEKEPEKHLAVIPGNHEIGRVIYYTSLFGINLIEDICVKNNIIYSEANTYFKLKINYVPEGDIEYNSNVEYLFYLSHGRSGAQTEDYILKELIRKGIGSEADFVIVGHTHHNHEKGFHWNFVKGNAKGVRKIAGIRPGSFLPDPKYTSFDRPRPQPDGNGILTLYTERGGYDYCETLDEWMLKHGN